MKKNLVILLVAVLSMGTGVAMAQSQAQEQTAAAATDDHTEPLQTEFYGCTLDVTSKKDLKKTLESRKFDVIDYEDAYVMQNASFKGFTFSAAMFEFDKNNTFTSITFLNSDLSREEAIDFSKGLYSVLGEKYTLIKTEVNGLDCYFTSSNNVTMVLSTEPSGDRYFVRLVYMVGTPDLKQTQADANATVTAQ